MAKQSKLDQKSKDVMVVAAHPDDEVLGCGGTIARHVASGDRVHILIAAEGITSRQLKRNRTKSMQNLKELAKSTVLACEILGAKGVKQMNLPDNRLDSIDRLDLIKMIEQSIETIKPHTVYVHHYGDVNIDHRRLNEAVITACRPTPGHSVQKILSYEVPSSTEWQPPGGLPIFQPNWFVDISKQWSLKRRALEAYSSEMRPSPHPRSMDAVEHLARWRGAQVGIDLAEAFCLLRHIT